MFPNGTQGQRPSRSGSRFPGFGDGISEGSGSGVRSSIKSHLRYLLAPRNDSSVSGSVPVEFDEEAQCEDSSASRGTSRDGRVSVDSSLSASSASVNIDDDVVGAVVGDIRQGWNYQDNMAIEEVERFDDISAVVFFWLQNRNHRSPLLLRMEALIVVRFSKDVLFLLNVNLLYPWTTF